MAEVIIDQFEMVPAPPPSSPPSRAADGAQSSAPTPEEVERLAREWEERHARVRAH